MVALDGISVVQTPEPASLTIMATGLALLGFFYRRRNRRAV
jgi:hypothetical protein